MIKVVFGFIVLLLCCLIGPDAAFAWGPCIHLHTGNYILGNLGLIDPIVAELLDSYRNLFLYGCLSADIFIGKGSRFTPSHCHNWSTGFRMLGAVNSPDLLAFSYGYLCHLAADTLAHNFYVPNVLDMSGGKSKLRHVYIEMLADRKVEQYSDQARELLRTPYRVANSFLRSMLEKKKFTFSVKKELFRRTVDLCNLKGWQNSVALLDKAVPMPEVDSYLDEMLNLSAGACLDFLQDPLSSVALNFDPIGSRNLRLVGRRDNFDRERGKLMFPTDVRLAKVAHF